MSMNSQVKSDKNQITEAINTHGIFFKQAVRKKLVKIQNVSFLGEEYPVNHLEGGALDLLIQVKTDKYQFIIPIECKRARTATKQWIFFKDPDNYSKITYSFNKNVCTAQNAAYFTQLGVSICLEGIEVERFETKNKKGMEISYKASSDPIWQSANQICKGTHGLIMDEIRLRNKNPEDQKMVDITILPLIITTATLLICESANNTIDIQTGNFKGELPLDEIPWVLLSHPFTPSQQFGSQRLEISKDQYEDFYNRGRNTKEGIIVLNANHINDFVSLLSKYP